MGSELFPWQVAKYRHLAIFRRQQTADNGAVPRNSLPAPNMLMSVEMVNHRLDTANQLVSELRKRINTFARAPIGLPSRRVEMLALHERASLHFKDKGTNSLIASLLPEDQRTDFLGRVRRIKTVSSHKNVS
jgi:hypothetical protein